MKGLFSEKNKKALEEEFLEAYDAYAEKILRHACLRVSDKSVAEDITSSTFMKAWDYLRNGSKVGHMKGFLYKIANNLIIDHYRTRKSSFVSIDKLDGIEGAEPPSDKDRTAEMDTRLSFENVKIHLNSLPEEYRDVLIYRYIDELEISEIKKLTGKSIANVYVTIHRALKKLKERMGEAAARGEGKNKSAYSPFPEGSTQKGRDL